MGKYDRAIVSLNRAAKAALREQAETAQEARTRRLSASEHYKRAIRHHANGEEDLARTEWELAHAEDQLASVAEQKLKDAMRRVERAGGR